LTSGGLALDARSLPPLTSGNALTVWAGLTAIKSVLREGSRSLDGLNVAVVGAAGQIGRAMSLMLSRHARRIILVGRDGAHENSQQRLRAVACAVAEDKISISDPCHSERDVEEIADESIGKGTIVLAENIQQIADADVIVAASSAIEPIIQSAIVKPGAIVCDLARPASVSDEVKSQRPDVRWLEGGLIRARSTKPFGLFAGPFPNVLYACVAETALWTLQTDLGAPSAVQFLQPGQITALGRAAARHGFEVSW
jgi:predicted amino acid dehydrogenase